MRRLLIFLFLAFLASCASQVNSGKAKPEFVSHLVFLWLKEPGNKEHQQTLRDAADRLQEIPGLIRVDHGLALPSPRDIVDDSFDVGYVMLFENEQAVRDYDPHPIHRDVADNTIKPLVKKVVVYDIKH